MMNPNHGEIANSEFPGTPWAVIVSVWGSGTPRSAPQSLACCAYYRPSLTRGFAADTTAPSQAADGAFVGLGCSLRIYPAI